MVETAISTPSTRSQKENFVTRKQMTALGICYFVVFTGLAAVVGTMPVYLTLLGQESTLIGFFLAAGYVALAVSTVAAGRLSDLLQRRKPLLILGGALCAPFAWMLGQTTNVILLMLMVVGLLFMMGLVTTMVSTLTGLFSDADNRGRLFGILNLSVGIGLMFGSFASGPIIDRWDYPTMFRLLAAFYLIVPAVGWFIQDKVVAKTENTTRVPMMGLLLSNRTFLLLFLASILSQAGNTLIFLTRPLIMTALDYDTSAVTTAAAVGSLITLPLPLIVGWLADYVGRKRVIVASFIGPIAGLLVLAGAIEIWHFWLASILQTIMSVSGVVGSSFITDTFSEGDLGTALSLLNATPWIGIVIGLSAGGLAISTFDMTPTLLIGAAVSFIALVMLLPMSMQPARS
jgi:MFS family permease